jgi:prepilin-type processing-associated H-X9-DG protein
LAHVGGDAEPTDLGGGGGGGVGIAFPDGHVGSEGGEATGDAPADSCSTAGHDGDPVGEQH